MDTQNIRNQYIDALLEKGIGGVNISGIWTPIYDLPDSAIVVLYDQEIDDKSDKFRMLDLFSGIGGFSLAASWVWGDDLEIVGFVEIDKFCQKVLHKHWPSVSICSNIKDFNYGGAVELITGGFPCQPFSGNGKQKGKEDNRYLWPEMFRVIKNVKPTWIIIENVVGFISMELESLLSDLESEKYQAQSFVIPAISVGTCHIRKRVRKAWANPQFSEWMMGYPIGWTDLERSEML